MNTHITGQRIRALRKQLGLTQEELAERARFYAPTGRKLVRVSISRAETGATRLDTWVVAALAQALEVTSEYLLGYTDDPSLGAEAIYPVPVPDTWDVVRELNDLPDDLRQKAMQIISDMLDFASSYSRGMLVNVLVARDPDAEVTLPEARSIVDRVLEIPEVRAVLAERLAAQESAIRQPESDNVS